MCRIPLHPPRRRALRLPGDAGAAERRIHPAACKQPPLFLRRTVMEFEYSSLLTRVICLRTKISSDCCKEQQFSALPLFGDAVCAAFHILFPFIGCGVVKKGTRCIDHVRGESAEVPVPGWGRGGRWGGRRALLRASDPRRQEKGEAHPPGEREGAGRRCPGVGGCDAARV